METGVFVKEKKKTPVHENLKTYINLEEKKKKNLNLDSLKKWINFGKKIETA